MDRKQREALVIALSEKGKTYREIAKEVRMSPVTIKAIRSRAGLDESTSPSSRTFELYSEGKTPLQVAIALNLEVEKAIQYHQQYLMLLGCTEFTKLYPQIKNNPWPFVNLVKLAIGKQMNAGHIIKLLEIANNDLLLVESKYENRKKELELIDCRKNNANSEYQLICDEVSNLRREKDQFQSNIGKLRHEEFELNQQKQRIENFVNNFQNNNETCMKIKQIVRDDIESIISNPKRLLRYILMSIFESARRHPGDFQALYYNISSAELRVRSSLQALTNPNGQNSTECEYNEGALEKTLLDEAEKINSKLVNDITNEITNDTKSSQVLHVRDKQNGLPMNEVYLTNLDNHEGEVPISEIMSNFALEICNSINVTNERSRRTDTRLDKDETDTYKFQQEP